MHGFVVLLRQSAYVRIRFKSMEIAEGILARQDGTVYERASEIGRMMKAMRARIAKWTAIIEFTGIRGGKEMNADSIRRGTVCSWWLRRSFSFVFGERKVEDERGILLAVTQVCNLNMPALMCLARAAAAGIMFVVGSSSLVEHAAGSGLPVTQKDGAVTPTDRPIEYYKMVPSDD